MTLIAQVVTDALNFGALGLCAVMIWQNWKDRQQLARELDRRHAHAEQLLQNNIAAMNRLADALADRPCLTDDSRVRPPT